MPPVSTDQREAGHLYPVAKAVIAPAFRFAWRFHVEGAENVPADGPDPIAIVNEFGVGSGTAVSLQSAGPDVTTAITALLLQGYKAVPDCSYTDFGVDARYDPGTRQQLLVAILVGK